MELPKRYNHVEAEDRWKKFWEKEKVYKFDPRSKKVYSIDTPPPTVSGDMHIGHSFSYAHEDFIARYRRMNGSVFYPFGTDDNGLPTERLVENLKKVKSKKMPRGDFIKLCLKTLKEISPKFIQDWKDLGISCDYDVFYSTIDDNSRRVSQESFIELYKKGLIYRKEFPTIWDTHFQTPVAQAELEDKEKSTLFSTLKFFVGKKELLIATTRPELLGACVAVFVNPGDKRYRDLIGKKAKIPLFGHEVPIIADKSAEVDKGTGVLMVCSYGDKYDVDAINRHKLEPIDFMNLDGTVKIGEYKSMSMEEARKKVLEDLDKKGLIKEQKEIAHIVNVYEKSGKEIEFLPTEQWFIKILDKKKELIKQGKKINWYPGFMFKRYENWIEGLDWDWSISRERHFGIPIPVWYCKKCDEVILPGAKELPIDPTKDKPNKKCKCGSSSFTPEERVLDTWATSSLTPQLASSLVNKKVNIPYSLRPQAHDIIRTWAFYTITKAYLHENKIPWKDIMVSGFVTLKGKKMSKSKGISVNPREVMNKYGSDALRFWAAGASLGKDLPYNEEDIILGTKIVTKLWNASKFSIMHLEDFNNKKVELDLVDAGIISKFNDLVKECTEAFDKYEYSKVRMFAESFFWNTICDNYLEIAKDRLYNPEKRGKESRRSAQYTLYYLILNTLKLFAPVMPFITEEIYHLYFDKKEKKKSIHICEWSKVDKKLKNEAAEKTWEKFVEILGRVREAKAKHNKSMKHEIVLTISDEDRKILMPALEDLKAVCNAKDILFGKFNIAI
jgi:valyl-tRNA synthetase